MPFPLIPFFAGAATGAVLTYLLSGKLAKRDSEEDKIPADSFPDELETPSAGKEENPDASDSS